VIDRERLIGLIDDACWDARGYGHEDNGLQDYDTGEDIDIHPEAILAADIILKELKELGEL
jgi:hypothetical protein